MSLLCHTPELILRQYNLDVPGCNYWKTWNCRRVTSTGLRLGQPEIINYKWTTSNRWPPAKINVCMGTKLKIAVLLLMSLRNEITICLMQLTNCDFQLELKIAVYNNNAPLHLIDIHSFIFVSSLTDWPQFW